VHTGHRSDHVTAQPASTSHQATVVLRIWYQVLAVVCHLGSCFLLPPPRSATALSRVARVLGSAVRGALPPRGSDVIQWRDTMVSFELNDDLKPAV
jgi:hypothetical protein